jgi:hypothetical protein
MPVSLLAEWTSPDILIDESWGGGSSEIGVHLGRVPDYDNFPSRYDVSDDGKKVIYDRMNKRFKIYDSKSEIVDVIDSPISFSISSRNYAFFIKNNIMLVGKKIYLFTIDGLLISVSDIPMNTNRGIDILIKSDDLIFIKDPAVNSQKWFTYSAEGELLETSYRRP